VFSGRLQKGGVGGRTRGVCLDFQLSAGKLHFTFQLLSVPLDSRQGREQGPQGGPLGEEGFGSWWGSLDGWGHALGRTGPGNFRCTFQCFSRKGGVWSLSLGRGVFGDLAASQPQQEACEFHTDETKKQPWTLPGCLSAERQSSPEKTGTQNCRVIDSWCCSTFIFPYCVDKGKGIRQRECVSLFHFH